MVKSRKSSLPISEGAEPQSLLPERVAVELAETPPANGMDEWSQRVMKNMKRMSIDEEYRKEIAKKLS